MYPLLLVIKDNLLPTSKSMEKFKSCGPITVLLELKEQIFHLFLMLMEQNQSLTKVLKLKSTLTADFIKAQKALNSEINLEN